MDGKTLIRDYTGHTEYRDDLSIFFGIGSIMAPSPFKPYRGSVSVIGLPLGWVGAFLLGSSGM